MRRSDSPVIFELEVRSTHPMTEIVSTNSGWTLAQTLVLTADPIRWKDWIDGHGSIILSSSGVDFDGDLLPLELRESCWTNLCEGKLVATIARTPKGKPTSIKPKELLSVFEPVWQASSVVRKLAKKKAALPIRVFPVLLSPTAACRIAGLGLAEVLRRFLLDDPEVLALNARLKRPKLGFEGSFPGVSDNWPLGLTDDEFGYRIVESSLVRLDRPLPAPSKEQFALAVALNSRLQALRQYLSEGRVLGWGAFSQTGAFGSIDPQQWARSDISINAQNGDLCDGQLVSPIVRWSGISLRSVRSAVMDGPVTTPVKADSRLEKPNRHAPASESTLAAISELWPDGIPKGLRRTKRNDAIIQWQREKGLAVVSEKTIDRSVARAKSTKGRP
jgi:hypothetical protein